MMARTHIPIGVAAAIGISSIANIKDVKTALVAAAIGSIVVDIDHPGAMINQKILLFKNKLMMMVTYLSLAAIAVYIYEEKGIITFLYFIPICLMIALSKHRGITHSIIGVLIWVGVLYKINLNYHILIGFSIGYIMHLLADFFTDEGIQLFWPMAKRVKAPLTITSNGLMENIIGMTFIAISLYFVYNKFF